jgi:predicted esterase
MTNNPNLSLETTTPLGKLADEISRRSRDLYGEVCRLEILQLAYAQVRKQFSNLALEGLGPEAIENKKVDRFLWQLSDDLRAQLYRPVDHAHPYDVGNAVEGEGPRVLRDQVVRFALRMLLEPFFSPTLPCDARPEKAMAWIASIIERRFTRVYALRFRRWVEGGHRELLLERVSRSTGNGEIVNLMKMLLAMSESWGASQQDILAPLLVNIAYAGIDHLLQQIQTVGREGSVYHVYAARWSNEVVLFFDTDPRYDWLLPAAQHRLRDELTAIKCPSSDLSTQSVDLTRGERLRVLGFELWLTSGRDGSARTHYKQIEHDSRRAAEGGIRRFDWPRYYPNPGILRRCWDRIRIGRLFRRSGIAWRRIVKTEANWCCLPILLRAGFMRVRRQPWNLVVMLCGTVVLLCLLALSHDIYQTLSREVPAGERQSGGIQTGFYLGQYNPDPLWGRGSLSYGLYKPPHLKGKPGPFPLVVFLHGPGERTSDRIFDAGLPHSIAFRFGEHTENGPFPFIALFPIDRTGQWQAESPEVKAAMTVVDHVIRRHQIDPTRVYLTGFSSGGNGVWRLAEADPSRWAAIAPISSFIRPNLERVRHIPIWIFHGAMDDKVPVRAQQALVQTLKATKADVRYTEYPDKGHSVWHASYGSKELYDWFESKRKSF